MSESQMQILTAIMWYCILPLSGSIRISVMVLDFFVPLAGKCCQGCRCTGCPPLSSCSSGPSSSSSSYFPSSWPPPSPSPPSRSPWLSSGGSAATSPSSSWRERWRIEGWPDPSPSQLYIYWMTSLLAPCRWDVTLWSLKEKEQKKDDEKEDVSIISICSVMYWASCCIQWCTLNLLSPEIFNLKGQFSQITKHLFCFCPCLEKSVSEISGVNGICAAHSVGQI